MPFMGLGVLVPITFFIVWGVVMWKRYDSSHDERRAIIEKGLNPADYKELYKHHGSTSDPLASLKWGLLAIFVGFGGLLAVVLDEWFHLEHVVYPGLMLIFGGIGLIVFYAIASKKGKEQ